MEERKRRETGGEKKKKDEEATKKDVESNDNIAPSFGRDTHVIKRRLSYSESKVSVALEPRRRYSSPREQKRCHSSILAAEKVITSYEG